MYYDFKLSSFFSQKNQSNSKFDSSDKKKQKQESPNRRLRLGERLIEKRAFFKKINAEIQHILKALDALALQPISPIKNDKRITLEERLEELKKLSRT